MGALQINHAGFQTLFDEFELASFELFDSLGCDVAKNRSGCSDDGLPCATISAHSDQLDLELHIKGPVSFLLKTYPLAIEYPISSDDLTDWLMEISNRLMGSLKNRLLNFNFYLQLSTPEIPESGSLIQDNQSQTQIHRLLFRQGNEVFECSLKASQLSASFKLENKNECQDNPEVEDGELELF